MSAEPQEHKLSHVGANGRACVTVYCNNLLEVVRICLNMRTLSAHPSSAPTKIDLNGLLKRPGPFNLRKHSQQNIPLIKRFRDNVSHLYFL